MGDFTRWPKIGLLKDSVHWYNKHKDKFNLPDELTFEGTVKLHGTNAGIRYNKGTCRFSAQSRNGPLSLTKDNYGFYQFYRGLLADEDGADFVANLFNLLTDITGEDVVTVFGEWVGKGIQHGVGISNLEKRAFVVFGMVAGDGPAQALPVFVENRELGIFNVLSVEQTYLTVDMTDKEDLIRFSEDIEQATTEYEENCPFTKFLFREGVLKEEPECKIGEGLVWTCVDLPELNELSFKSKGSKHSGNKKNEFKVIAPIDTEVLKSIDEFVSYALNEARLKQGLENVGGLETQYTGDYIKWILKDIEEEDQDVFLKLGVPWKQVGRELANRAREYFSERLIREALRRT